MKKPESTNCHYCGIFLEQKYITIDHIIPKTKGGKELRQNKVFACSLCNLIKGDTDYDIFVELLKIYPINPAVRVQRGGLLWHVNDGKAFSTARSEWDKTVKVKKAELIIEKARREAGPEVTSSLLFSSSS